MRRESGPSFFVVGTEKGGTTWLFHVLSQHPQIFLPDTKELGFFNARNSEMIETDRFRKRGWSWYLRFFAHRGDKIAGDITPMYLCDELAPGRIRAFYPEAKIIAILRNPVDRAISHYWMKWNMGKVALSLDEVAADTSHYILQRGLYSAQIARYLALFPSDQILFLTFEELMRDRARQVARICSFLGTSDSDFGDIELDEPVNAATAYRARAVYNLGVGLSGFARRSEIGNRLVTALKRAGVHRGVRRWNERPFSKPHASAELRAKLSAFYQRDIALCEQLLRRDLSAWRHG